MTLGKWKVVVNQKASRPIRVVHHKANDRAVGGVQHRQGEHMDPVRRQHADQVVQPSEPVRGKHRELSDSLRLAGGSGFHCHNATTNKPPRLAQRVTILTSGRVNSRIVARAVAAEVTRRKCFRAKIRLLTSAATILERTLRKQPAIKEKE